MDASGSFTFQPLGFSRIGTLLRRLPLRIRDGNGDPIPDSPRGIPLLGDGDGEISSPTGCKRGKFLPRRVNGDGDGEAFPIPVPRGDPLNDIFI
jgi:hypothetical protein